METHEEQTSRRLENRYRPMGELIRGLFFILFGLFAIFGERMGLAHFRISQTTMNIAGAILLIYGLFRVYNGIRKLFFNRN